jgi:hypothetical protein
MCVRVRALSHKKDVVILLLLLLLLMMMMMMAAFKVVGCTRNGNLQSVEYA